MFRHHFAFSLFDNQRLEDFTTGVNSAKENPGVEGYSVTLCTGISDTQFMSALSLCRDFSAIYCLAVIANNYSGLDDMPQAIPIFTEILNVNPHLESICFNSLRFTLTDAFKDLVAAIKTHKGLTKLTLTGTFLTADAQAYFLTMLADHPALTSLTIYDEKHESVGLAAMLGANKVLKELEMKYLNKSVAQQLCQALSSNKASVLSEVKLHCKSEQQISGDELTVIFDLLVARNPNHHYSLLVTGGILSFSSKDQVEHLYQQVRRSVMSFVLFDINNIVGESAEVVSYYQDRFSAIYNRNCAAVYAFTLMNDEQDEDKMDYTLAELVYLFHQQNFEDKFHEPAPASYPVRITTLSFFKLVNSPDSENIPLDSEHTLNRSLAYLREHKWQFSL